MPGITTPYTRWGDWVPVAALVAWAVLCLVGRGAPAKALAGARMDRKSKSGATV
jgi:hypothetical protein